MKTDAISNQLRWVILLLATAVILPTVCLLWFMNQAVKNEQLAVRSKLSSVYHGEVGRVFGPFLEWINAENTNTRTSLSQNNPYQAFQKLAEEESVFESEGLYIYDDAAQEILYPTLWGDFDALDTPPELEEAIRLEFIENTPQTALEEYSRVLKSIDLDSIPFRTLVQRCSLAEARILHKLGDIDGAISLCESALREPRNAIQWYFYTTANLKILDLLEIQGITKGKQAERLDDRLGNLLYVIESIEYIPSGQRVFAYDQVSAFAEKHSDFLTRNMRSRISNLKQRFDLERKSLAFISMHPDFDKSKQSHPLVERVKGTDLYAVNLYDRNLKAVRLVDIETIIQELSKDLSFSDDIHFRILDTDNHVVTGSTDITHSPFLTLPIASFFEWTVEFYETDVNANVFENAAKRQTTIYLWTGVLVALLVLLAGAVSIRAVNQQIKMNRLKNDFIATVTHELKTPLSSMRVLVDTLLEGNYEDAKTTVPEYLGLIASENKRLSHLIDSFLTFSRMERNKQVFDFEAVSPKDIAAAGAEAAQTKLNGDHCEFTLEIEDALPAVAADKDAMVTVLVNLLENACKYSGDNKQISLHVFQRNGDICFEVNDNGIGISKRVQKKIFNRFYQADNRLSRSVEGCGLGLSIVKFIVDAHKGKIDVKSDPGKGSVFTIRLQTIK